MLVHYFSSFFVFCVCLFACSFVRLFVLYDNDMQVSVCRTILQKKFQMDSVYFLGKVGIENVVNTVVCMCVCVYVCVLYVCMCGVCSVGLHQSICRHCFRLHVSSFQSFISCTVLQYCCVSGESCRQRRTACTWEHTVMSK